MATTKKAKAASSKSAPAKKRAPAKSAASKTAKAAAAPKKRASSRSTKTEVEVEGRQLTLSNLDKVLYPSTGFAKRDVIDYYTRIAPYVLPHLHNRPVTLKRYPNGVTESFFYEKRCPQHRPDWVETASVWSDGNNAFIDFCLFNDLPTLVWAANLADLELHTSLSLAREKMEPTTLAFDLDPGAPANIIECCQVAIWLRDIFADFGLEMFPKTSGSKGMQVYVPLNTEITYDETKPFARAVAQLLEKQHPDHVISNMKKELRKDKVFIDWSQNDDMKTTVCVYSLRATEQPQISTPLEWDEVESALKHKKPERLVFSPDKVIKRADKLGDLFEPVLTVEQELPSL